MPSCPFCQAQISEDMSLYGGHCPSCLIEIPGEEAVTDPGLKPQETVEVQKKSNTGLIVAAAVLIIGGGGAAWFMGPGAGPAPVSASNNQGANPILFSAHEDAEIATPEKTPQRRRRGSGKRTVTKYVGSPERPSPATDTPAGASEGAAPTPTGKGVGMGSLSDGAFGVIGAAPRSRAPETIVLKDSLQIEEMVGRVLTRGSKQIERCYNNVLKLDPSVKGAWYVDFTIEKNGQPVAVSVEPLETPHGEIEACITRAVGRWRFQRIAEPVDIARRYRFGG